MTVNYFENNKLLNTRKTVKTENQLYLKFVLYFIYIKSVC